MKALREKFRHNTRFRHIMYRLGLLCVTMFMAWLCTQLTLTVEAIMVAVLMSSLAFTLLWV